MTCSKVGLVQFAHMYPDHLVHFHAETVIRFLSCQHKDSVLPSSLSKMPNPLLLACSMLENWPLIFSSSFAWLTDLELNVIPWNPVLSILPFHALVFSQLLVMALLISLPRWFFSMLSLPRLSAGRQSCNERNMAVK